MLSYREIKAAGIYWIYSKKGPDDNRKMGEYQLARGVVTVPVMGSIARDLVARGLCAIDAEVLGRPEFRPDPSGGFEGVPVAVLPAFLPAPSPCTVEPSPPADPALPKRKAGRPRKASE